MNDVEKELAQAIRRQAQLRADITNIARKLALKPPLEHKEFYEGKKARLEDELSATDLRVRDLQHEVSQMRREK